MSAVYLLVLMLSHQALSYYFYNPLTHQILSLQSLRDKPYGFELIPAPKHQNHPFRKDRTPNSHCTDSGFRCTTPYPKAQTFQFECERDSQCPTSFKCCPQKCFQHKICSKAKLRPADVTNPPSNSGVCPTNTFECSRPFPYTSTALFECKSDRQCPESFICCQQSCFVHKICSRSFAAVGTTPYVEELKLWGKSNATEVTTPQSVTTEVTESETEEVEATSEGASEMTDETEETESSTVASTTITSTTTEATTVTDAEVSLDTTTTETTTTTEEDFSTVSDALPETETTTTEELTTEMEATDGEDDENGEDVGELVSMKPVEFKSLRTTSDPNAIVPDYSEYYYDYDNRTDTDDDY